MSYQQPWDSGQGSDWSTSSSAGWDDSAIPQRGGLSYSGPPTAYLAVSGAALVAAVLLLALARSQPWASGLAWLLAGPVNVLAIGAFLGEDTRRRAGTLYVEKAWTKAGYQALLVLGMICAISASWFFADWAARQ